MNYLTKSWIKQANKLVLQKCSQICSVINVSNIIMFTFTFTEANEIFGKLYDIWRMKLASSRRNFRHPCERLLGQSVSRKPEVSCTDHKSKIELKYRPGQSKLKYFQIIYTLDLWNCETFSNSIWLTNSFVNGISISQEIKTKIEIDKYVCVLPARLQLSLLQFRTSSLSVLVLADRQTQA